MSETDTDWLHALEEETMRHDDSEVFAKGDRGVLIVSAWIAEQKGLR